MTYLFLFLFSIISASASEDAYSEFTADNDLWWMSNTELVLVVNPAKTDVLESAVYVGPMGGPNEIDRYPRVISEVLMGSVKSGKIEVWNNSDRIISVPQSGILFARRWAVAHVTGAPGGTEPMYNIYASDAIGLSTSRRQLAFINGEVIAEGGHKICVGKN